MCNNNATNNDNPGCISEVENNCSSTMSYGNCVYVFFYEIHIIFYDIQYLTHDWFDSLFRSIIGVDTDDVD